MGKANQTLGFLRRNIKVHNQDLKSTAYVRPSRDQLPHLECTPSVCSPNTTRDIDNIESAQLRTARWATRDYKQTSSVTEMLGNLRWRPLDQRRVDISLIILYKTTHMPLLQFLSQNTLYRIAGSPNSSILWHTDESVLLAITISSAPSLEL